MEVDFVGLLPESSNGNSCILVIGDYFICWIEALPFPNQETSTVKQMVENIMTNLYNELIMYTHFQHFIVIQQTKETIQQNKKCDWICEKGS